jgi:hypothetical protein
VARFSLAASPISMVKGEHRRRATTKANGLYGVAGEGRSRLQRMAAEESTPTGSVVWWDATMRLQRMALKESTPTGSVVWWGVATCLDE